MPPDDSTRSPSPGTTPPVPAGGPPRKSSSRTGWRWHDHPEVFLILGLLGGVVLAGGGNPEWARAFVLLMAGAWLVVNPPKEAPARLFEIGLILLVVIACAASFAPASWVGRASWRFDAQTFSLLLPGTNATSPWLAAEALAQLFAGVAFLYVWWNLHFDHETRKNSLWGIAGVAAVFSIITLVGHVFNAKYPLGREATIFSFFPNRNQSALWYCLGGVTAFGLLLESTRRRRKQGFGIAGLLVIACMLGVIFSLSRMALALFALGTVVVVVMRFGRDAGNYLLRLFVPLAILGVSLLVFFNPQTLDRLHVSGSAGVERDFRLELWRDTVTMARAQPAGVGLDQFEDVFPQYRNLSKVDNGVRHPDSDWFWLLGETGWLGVLAGALVVASIVNVLVGRRSQGSGPYRHLAALCAGLFLLHSLVDVPAHRFGTWLLFAFFISLAAPDGAPVPSLFPRAVFRAAGALLFLIGCAWLAAAAGLPLNSTTIEAKAYARSNAATLSGDAEGAIAAVDKVIAIRPLRWWPYFQRARAELALRSDQPAALLDFQRTRFLEPVWAEPAFMEGELWADVNPVFAFVAWREAMQRHDAHLEGDWALIQDRLRSMPNGAAYESTLSKSHASFRYKYLLVSGPDRFGKEWADELVRDPLLQRYTPAQRQDLLEHWASLEGVGALNFIEKHPMLVPQPWLVQWRALASSGHPRDALDAARKRLKPLSLPDGTTMEDRDNATLSASLHGNPPDVEAGGVLFQRQLVAGQLDDAMKTLDTLNQMKRVPPFVSWWRADLLLRAGKDAEAWAAFQPFLEFEHQTAASTNPAQNTPLDLPATTTAVPDNQNRGLLKTMFGN